MFTQPQHHAVRRAFSLMELMIVMLIILLVITIAIPSLSGARNMARSSATQGMMNQITQAAAQFERDNRRLPGYFSGSDMGHGDNATRGFAAIQNVMLDLAGGITDAGATGSIQVGPHTGAQVYVNPGYIGVAREGNNVYFTPDARHFVAQEDDGRQVASVAAHREVPTLVDAWGTPLLAWVQNELAMGPITSEADFAQVAFNSSQPVARFYWNANAAFIQAPSLGRRGVDQNHEARGSILAFNDNNARRRSMIGVLGHPSFPNRDAGGTPPVIPTTARGKFIIHSAGADGYYFSRRDRGARQFPLFDASGNPNAGSFFIDYRVNFVPNVNNPTVGYTDRDGRPTNIDIVEQFNDLLAVGGN